MSLGLTLFLGGHPRFAGPTLVVEPLAGVWRFVMEVANPPFATLMVLATNGPAPLRAAVWRRPPPTTTNFSPSPWRKWHVCSSQTGGSSLVFAHKDVRYWNFVVNAFAAAGLAHRATTTQVTNKSSIHYKKNPLKVLSNQFIISFQKSAVLTPARAVKRTLDEAIVAAAERVILREDGATTDEIYESVVPELIESGLLAEAMRKIKTLAPILDEHFDLDTTTNRWQPKKGAEISSWIPRRDRVRYLIRSVLNEKRRATLDEIHAAVFPSLSNGMTPTRDEFSDVLEEIAHSPDGRRWELRPGVIVPDQAELGLEGDHPTLPIVPPGVMGHSDALFRTASLGHSAGFETWIGINERHQIFAGEELRTLSPAVFPVELTSAVDKSRIPNIDCIWLHRGVPIAAFEIEESTGMRDALERFSQALRRFPALGGQCYLVVPDARRRKMNLELSQSSYIGHPQYMENKVRFIMYSELVTLYDELRASGAPATIKVMTRRSKPAYRASLSGRKKGDPQSKLDL